MRRHRVVRLVPVLDFGGVESRVALQAGLIDRDRFDFRVCTFWKKGAAARTVESHGITVDELGIDPAIRNPRATRALIHYLRQTRPHVLHASIGEANFHAALVAPLLRVPATIVEEVGLPDRRLPARLVYAGLYRRVSAVVAVSEATRRYLIEREWAPASRAHLLCNCARPEFFTADKRPASVATAPLIALTVGRLIEVKNHARLLNAFAQVLKVVPDARLQLAGEGPLRASLERLSDQLGLQRSVEFLGFRSDVLDLLRRADVFLLPSLSEGHSIALAEAMAAGTPVIASNVGGSPEVMSDLGADWLVEPEDICGWTAAIVRMFELSPEARLRIGVRAAALAQRFGPDAYMSAVENLYRHLIEQTQPRRVARA